jgi:hypothetical protein
MPPEPSPRKRKADQQQFIARRKSSRIGSSSTAKPSTEPAAPRELSVASELSGFSTNPEPAETWPALANRARTRIGRYVAGIRDDGKLVACLRAFVDWLPEGGRESVARDILECDTDEMLYGVFDNLRRGLLHSSTFEGKFIQVS